MLYSKFLAIIFIAICSVNNPSGTSIPVKDYPIPQSETIHNHSQNDKVLICISKTSYRYHLGMCRGMKACTHETKWVNKSQAVNMNKTLCGYCANGQY